jgi:hypothetical protein
MTRSNEDIWLDRGETWGGRFTRHPFGWGFASIIGVVVVVLALGWLIGWFNAATEVVSPANVRTQYHAVITDWNAMGVAAENACNASDSGNSEQGPTLLEDPAFAYKAQYRHITVDYNARQNNIFEAEQVGPSGYPRVAPTLSQMQRRVC